MSYVKPGDARSPKAHWSLIDVLVEGKAGTGAYALGLWDTERAIAFRWNGTSDNPLGNPQSRGKATWTMLEKDLHESIVRQLPPEKAALARTFLGIKVMFEGPSFNSEHKTLAIYDLSVSPPIVATVACTGVRELVQRRDLSDSECQLLVGRNMELISAVATVKFGKGEFQLGPDGRTRLIPLTAEDLQPIASQISTEILNMARLCHWTECY